VKKAIWLPDPGASDRFQGVPETPHAAQLPAGKRFVYNLYPLTHCEPGEGFNMDTNDV